MGGKSRVPMQVAPEFEVRIKSLQKKIMMKQGKNVSLRDLTERLIKTPDFENLEKALLNSGKMDLKLNLDVRKK